ncbi:MAG TPA: glycosyltransferase [Chloroflexota bacterium]|nr:glycosyltransferase [Chloroflexota bacterium]
MDRVRTLFVVSADLPSGVAARRTGPPTGPRKDYAAIADALRADVLDRTAARRGAFQGLLARTLGVAVAQAWLAFRRRGDYDAILTDGEHIGIWLALLLKLVEGGRSRTAHVTIGHRISAPKKRFFFTRLRVWTHVQRVLLHATLQRDLARRALGVPARRLALVPYQVDTEFWDAVRVPEIKEDEQLVASAGLELRDYPTLFRAAAGMAAQVVVAAASHWSKRRNTALAAARPWNVTVTSLDYQELRALYARAAVVVVPVVETDFQAGVTTVLEAMAMGKPVVVTHTAGQTDVVEDRRAATRGGVSRGRPESMLRTLARDAGLPWEQTGMYVPVGDALALRRALDYLLGHPEERRRMGQAGRRLVAGLLRVDQFAERVAEQVRAAVAEVQGEVERAAPDTVPAPMAA